MSSNTWGATPMSHRVRLDGGSKIRWPETAEDVNSDPDAWLYRERTVALLRRFLKISIEVGRLPSLLGRELFRSKVTSYRMSSFEDGVIFVHDVERALDRLGEFQRQLIGTIIFQEYTQEEAAQILHCARRTVCREYPAALDRMSEIFLAGGLLNRLPSLAVEKDCQEGCDGDIALSDCKHPE
jgi:DNA-directed RNA polymerase specialized sigma24 family protein